MYQCTLQCHCKMHYQRLFLADSCICTL
jgi:hypothetical protein